jgi:NAD(P)-dependent dehydrogenase (short-subunit alcohol dehydrogenase family)
MEEVVKRFDAIDVLVNNMAVFEPYVKIADSDQDIWWQTFQANLKGMYLVTRAALPSSRENKHIIVNVTSTLPVHFSSLKEFQPRDRQVRAAQILEY